MPERKGKKKNARKEEEKGGLKGFSGLKQGGEPTQPKDQPHKRLRGERRKKKPSSPFEVRLRRCFLNNRANQNDLSNRKK